MALLAAAGEIPAGACEVVALGELALDGSVRSARGGLGAAVVASEMGLPCLLPPGSASEAGIVPSVELQVVGSLPAAVSAALARPGSRRRPRRPSPPSPVRPTWPRCGASPWPNWPWRRRPPAAITCS